jgi:hypothetical protein
MYGRWPRDSLRGIMNLKGRMRRTVEALRESVLLFGLRVKETSETPDPPPEIREMFAQETEAAAAPLLASAVVESLKRGLIYDDETVRLLDQFIRSGARAIITKEYSSPAEQARDARLARQRIGEFTASLERSSRADRTTRVKSEDEAVRRIEEALHRLQVVAPSAANMMTETAKRDDIRSKAGMPTSLRTPTVHSSNEMANVVINVYMPDLPNAIKTGRIRRITKSVFARVKIKLCPLYPFC